MRNAFVVSAVGVLMLSCGGTPGGGTTVTTANKLRAVQATGGVAGGKGKLRLTFENPLAADTSVTIKSSAPTIADAAATLSAPKGSVLADFEYDAKLIGSTVFYATLGEDTRSTNATVVDKVRLTQISASGASLEVGASGALYFYLNIDPPTATTISVASDNPAVVSVPATMVISPFANPTPYSYDNNNRLTISGVAAGSTTVHAKLEDATFDASYTVVAKAHLSGASAYPTLVEAGGAVSFNLGADAVLAQPTTVAYTSSNTAVLPSGSVIIPAGSTNGNVRLTSLAAGSTVLHATLDGVSFDTIVQAVASPTLRSAALNSVLQVGMPAYLSLTFDVTASKAHSFTVTSSDPTVISVPSMGTLLPNDSNAYVSVNVLKLGNTILTISYGGQDTTLPVTVNGTSSSTLQAYGQSLSIGAIGVLQAYGNATGTMTVVSSDPAVLQVPMSVGFSNNASIQVKGLKAGKVQVTMTVSGQSVTVPITVFDHPSISFGPRVYLATGAKQNQPLSLNAIPPVGVSATFESSNPAVVAAPAPVSFNGSTYAQVQLEGLTTGTSILTVTMGSQKQSAVVYVGSSSESYPVLQSVGISASRLQVGAATTLVMSLSTEAVSTVPITVVYSKPGVAEIVGTAALSTGEQQATFAVRAVTPGTTDITLTREGISFSAQVTVVATPKLTLYTPTPLKVGEVNQGYVYSDCLLAAEVRLPLVSDAPAKVAVLSTLVTLAPGTDGIAGYFGIKGVAAGMATVTAGTGAGAVTSMVTVTP